MRGRRQRGPWQHDTGVCEKITPPEKKTRGTFTLCKHQIRGWIAVSPAVVQGKGLRKRSVFSQAPVVPKVAGPKSCIQGSARGDLNNVHEQAFTKRRLRTLAQGETDGPDVTSLTKTSPPTVHETLFTNTALPRYSPFRSSRGFVLSRFASGTKRVSRRSWWEETLAG